MKLRYIAGYTGKLPWLGNRVFKPNEEFEIQDENIAKKLLSTGQFEEVKIPKPSKKLPTGGE